MRETHVTYYCPEWDLNTPIVKVPHSDNYDCTKVAKGISDYLNANPELLT